MTQEIENVRKSLVVAFVLILAVGMTGVPGTVSADISQNLYGSDGSVDRIDNKNTATTTIGGTISFYDGPNDSFIHDIGGANVTLKNMNTGNIVDTTTADSDGSYQFEVSQDGDYNVTATKNGFYKGYTETYDVDVSEDDVETVNVFLEPKSDVIAFNVNSLNSGPIANAEVQVYNTTNQSWVANLTTNQNGDTSSINMITSDYRITVDKKGYKVIFKEDSPYTPFVAQGGNAQKLQITLESTKATIMGSVINKRNGQLLPGVNMRIYNFSTGNDVDISTNSNGKYSINVKAGDYGVETNDSCYTDSYQSVSVKDGNTKTVNLTVEPAGFIKGNITDPNGNRVYADVEIRNASTGDLVKVVEGVNGNYSAKVATGKYRVVANESQGKDKKIATVTKCGTTTTDLQLSTKKSYIVGIITDPQNNPVNKSVTVKAANQGSGNVYSTTSNANNGTYLIKVPKTGKYGVYVDDVCYTRAVTQVSINKLGTTQTANLVVKEAGELTVYTNDSNGNQIRGASVKIYDKKTGQKVAQYKSAPYNKIKLETGKYVVKAQKKGVGKDQVSVEVKNCKKTKAKLQLSKTGTVQGQATGSSSGSSSATASLDSHTVAYAKIKFKDKSSGNVVRTVEADRNGSYSADLKPGTYEVVAVKDGFKKGTKEVEVEEEKETEADTVLQVNSNNVPPTAKMVFDRTPETGEKVEFDASISADFDGKITKWEFDLDGDGKYEKTDTKDGIVEYTYNNLGKYNAKVKITDEGGKTDTFSGKVVVDNKYDNLKIDFSIKPGLMETGTEGKMKVVIENYGSRDIKNSTVSIDGVPEKWKISTATGSSISVSGNKVFMSLDKIKAGSTKDVSVKFKTAQNVLGEPTLVASVFENGAEIKESFGSVRVLQDLSPKKVVANLESEDNKISFGELQKAITYWTSGKELPGTDGDIIKFGDLQKMIQIWVQNKTVGS